MAQPVPPQLANRPSKAARIADASRAALRRVRAREKELKQTAIGGGVAFVASRYIGRKRAEWEQKNQENEYELGSVKISQPLTMLGLGAAVAGAMGVAGDDQIDTALTIGGVGIFCADQAVTAYQTRLTEPPDA